MKDRWLFVVVRLLCVVGAAWIGFEGLVASRDEADGRAMLIVAVVLIVLALLGDGITEIAAKWGDKELTVRKEKARAIGEGVDLVQEELVRLTDLQGITPEVRAALESLEGRLEELRDERQSELLDLAVSAPEPLTDGHYRASVQSTTKGGTALVLRARRPSVDAPTARCVVISGQGSQWEAHVPPIPIGDGTSYFASFPADFTGPSGPLAPGIYTAGWFVGPDEVARRTFMVTVGGA